MNTYVPFTHIHPLNIFSHLLSLFFFSESFENAKIMTFLDFSTHLPRIGILLNSHDAIIIPKKMHSSLSLPRAQSILIFPQLFYKKIAFSFFFLNLRPRQQSHVAFDMSLQSAFCFASHDIDCSSKRPVPLVESPACVFVQCFLMIRSRLQILGQLQR